MQEMKTDDDIGKATTIFTMIMNVWMAEKLR